MDLVYSIKKNAVATAQAPIAANNGNWAEASLRVLVWKGVTNGVLEPEGRAKEEDQVGKTEDHDGVGVQLELKVSDKDREASPVGVLTVESVGSGVVNDTSLVPEPVASVALASVALASEALFVTVPDSDPVIESVALASDAEAVSVLMLSGQEE